MNLRNIPIVAKILYQIFTRLSQILSQYRKASYQCIFYFRIGRFFFQICNFFKTNFEIFYTDFINIPFNLLLDRVFTSFSYTMLSFLTIRIIEKFKNIFKSFFDKLIIISDLKVRKILRQNFDQNI